MKQTGAILFITCFLMMTFSKAITLVNFYWNQETITAKFCINKKTPKMNCNGKCFLAKQIKEQQQQEATDAIIELAKIDVFSSVSYFASNLERISKEIHFTFNNFSEPVLKTPQPALLKPPCA